jgi:hypothetical protein
VSEFSQAIAAIRTEKQSDLDAALAARPALVEAAAETAEAHNQANHRFHDFELRVARATRHGDDNIMGATSELLADERARRDRAAAAMMRAKRALENNAWLILPSRNPAGPSPVGSRAGDPCNSPRVTAGPP